MIILHLTPTAIFSMAAPQLVNGWKSFGGKQSVYKHESTTTKCTMTFAIYLPPQAETGKVPVLYWLSGLTCTEQNFITKAGAQKYAAEYGIAVVCPDTSPRGCNIEGENDSYDLGTGAGFYVDATVDKWKNKYNMYSYVTKELPALIEANFPVDPTKKSVFGHSMGGHGALICYLKNPGMYRSVSAFAPITNPINAPWGQKAFTAYLGPNQGDWKQWDATELVRTSKPPQSYILIDQGKADEFYEKKQLLPENFVEAARNNNAAVVLRVQEGYDHSYYFIASFVEDHIKYHAEVLLGK